METAFSIFAAGSLLVFAICASLALGWLLFTLHTLWDQLPIGTKSVLVGAHAFYLHPFFVALGWWRLYGFPWHPYLWLAFFVHDLGYWGKPNMDGPEGEQHPRLGAKIVLWVTGDMDWYHFTLFHSRHFALRAGQQYSRLCVADKLVTHYQPAALYIPMTRLTGELEEFMHHGRKADPAKVGPDVARMLNSPSPWIWYKGLRTHMARWAFDHSDLKPDQVTQLQSHN